MMLSDRWRAFISDAWPTLAGGGDACAPSGLLEHPKDAGFRQPACSESHGQVADWVASLPDGSRLHVHEYASGDWIVHRDRVDPARGVFASIWHVLTETRIGGLLSIGASFALGALVFRRMVP